MFFAIFSAIFSKVAAAVGNATAWLVSGWIGYATTAIVATAVTGGAIVGLGASGVVNISAGLGQQVNLPFSFKPNALGSLDQIYGSLTAGASAAITGAGVKLDPIQIGSKIAAVSDKIIAEANADKAALQKLADNANKLTGQTDDKQTVTPTSSAAAASTAVATTGAFGTATIAAATPTVAGTAESTITPTVATTRTVTPTPTNTQTATATPTTSITPTVTESPTTTPTGTITGTPTISQTPTISPTVTQTATPTSTPTPQIIVSNANHSILTLSNMIPGGNGISNSVTVQNVSFDRFTYALTTTCTAGCNLLWTDSLNGLQMAIDRGPQRSPTHPTTLPSGSTNLYTGPIQVSGLSMIGTMAPHTSDTVAVTVWLPLGVQPTVGPHAPLAINPGNQFQGLSLTVSFTWDATETGQGP